MRWTKKGWVTPKLVSADGKWEIFDGEFGHAYLKNLSSGSHYILTAKGAATQEAIKQSEEIIKDYRGP